MAYLATPNTDQRVTDRRPTSDVYHWTPTKMDSENDTRGVEPAQAGPDRKDFDDYASYEEGDSLVVCDRENANAWVKSDVTIEFED